MMEWSTTQWFIVGLAFLAGLFIGMMFCTGRKWKRKYHEETILRKEEVRRREELERAHKHHEAELIAARAKADKTPRSTT